MCLCMYVCMYNMFVCCVREHVCIHVCRSVCMYLCMHVSSRLLSIALRHSMARRAVGVHDILILVTTKPSTTLQPPEYRAAVNDLKVRERASVLHCSVDSLLSRRQYFLGKTGRWRSDNWYRRATHTDTVTWKDSDGLAWARRARVRVGADGETKISKEHNCLGSAFNAKTNLGSAFNAKSIALLQKMKYYRVG